MAVVPPDTLSPPDAPSEPLQPPKQSGGGISAIGAADTPLASGDAVTGPAYNKAPQQTASSAPTTSPAVQGPGTPVLKPGIAPQSINEFGSPATPDVGLDNPTPSQESLLRTANNPLSIPESANKDIINQTLQEAKAQTPAAPSPPAEPVVPAPATPTLGPIPGAPPDMDTSIPEGAPPDMVPQAKAPSTEAVPPPDMVEGATVQPAAPPTYNDQLEALSTKYNNDADAIAKGFYSHEIETPQMALDAILHARDKQDNKYAGMGEWQAEWAKTADDARNAWNWVTRTLAGAKATGGAMLEIPRQALSTVQNAAGIIAPSAEGQNPLQPVPGGPQFSLTPAVSAVAQGPLGSGVDIVTGGQGGNLALTPKDQQALNAQLAMKSQANQRALAVGTEMGLGQLNDWTINSVQNLIGLAGWAPNALSKAFGGPEIGRIDPKVQMYLLAKGIPIVSTQSYNEMDPKNIASNLVTGRYLEGMHAQEGAGYGTPTTENMLKAFNGQTVMTPEELAANGHPVPEQALKDTAATANLAAGYYTLGLAGRVLESAGLTGVLHDAVDSTLGSAANYLEQSAKAYQELKAPGLVAPTIGTGIRVGGRFASALTGQFISRQLGMPGEWGGIVGAMFRPKVTNEAIEGFLKNGVGWVPKGIATLARESADALQLARDDPGNLLATRSPLKQVMAMGIKHGVEGIESIAPTLLGATTPEQVGGQVAMGLGLSLLHAPNDAAAIAKNQLINSAFIRDFNRYSSYEPAEPPTPYGTDSWLDEQHALALNSVDPVTGKPVVSNSRQHLLNDFRTQSNGMLELYALNPKAYQTYLQKMRDLGWINNPDMNSRGVAIDPNPALAQARVLVRSDHIDDALMHELAHPIVNRMELNRPEDLQAMFQAYSRTNDPNEFTLNYTKAASGGASGTDYDSLPSEAGIANGTEKYVPGFNFMTKEDMQREMATEAVSGLLKGGSIKSLTRDPTMLHQVQQAFWRILDDMGFDPDMTRTISPLGLKQSTTAAMVLEPLVRQTLRDNAGKGVGVPPTSLNRKAPVSEVSAAPVAEPVAPELPTGVKEEDVQALMKARGGFSREQAIDLLQRQAGGAVPGAPQAPKQSPAEIAKDTLIRFQGFSQSEVDRHVPSDAKSAAEAIQNARKAILEERAQKEPKSEAPEGKPPQQFMPGPLQEQKSEEKPIARPTVAIPPTMGPPTTAVPGPAPPSAPVTRVAPNAPSAAAQPVAPAVLPAQPPMSEAPPETTAPEKPVETTPESAPFQKYLREEENKPAGEAQAITHGTQPVTPASRMRTATGHYRVTATEFGWVDRAAVAAHPDRYPSGNRGFPDFGTVDLSGQHARGVSLPPEDINAHYGNVMTRDANGVWHADPAFARAVRNGQIRVEVTNPETGKVTEAPLVDIGPMKSTGAGLDILHGTAQELGFTSGKATLSYRIIGGGVARTGVPYQNFQAQIGRAAVDQVGRLNTRQDPGTNGGELACADAVTRIVHDDLGIDLPKTLDTRELYDNLRRGGWKEVDPDTPGAIIVSPRTEGVHGHTGIVGEDGKIYSNSSRDGLWEQNYTVKEWEQHFGGKGLEIHAFVPTDQVGLAHGEEHPGAAIAERTTGARPVTGGTQSARPPAETAPATAPEAAPKPVKPPVSQEDLHQAINQSYPTEERVEVPPVAERAEAGPTAQHMPAALPTPNEIPEAQRQKVLETIGAQHAAGLAPGDDRVTYHPDSGFISGARFVQDDPFHKWLLSGLDPATRDHQLAVLREVEDAVANRKDLFVNYHSAPQAAVGPMGLPTAAQRAEAQAFSPAEQRAAAITAGEKGKADIQLAGKNLIPSSVGIALGKGDKPTSITYSGISPDKVASNIERISEALGPRSPYPLGGNQSVAQEDLRGYLSNLNAGYRGDGSAPLVPVEGHESDIPQTPQGFVPYSLGKNAKAKSDFFNLAVTGKGAKLSTSPKATKSALAFELARQNEGYAKGGYTNELAHQLAVEHGDDWLKDNLHSGYENLRADLTGEVNPSGYLREEKIHPGHRIVSKVLQQKGLPPTGPLKAGFMPPDLAEAEKQAILRREGKPEREAHPAGEGRGSIAPTEHERVGIFRSALPEVPVADLDAAWKRNGKFAVAPVVRDAIAKETPILRALAEERGELLPPMDRPHDATGEEHRVWFNPERKTVTKETYFKTSTDPNNLPIRIRYGVVPEPNGAGVRDATAREYLDRLDVDNEVFGRGRKFIGIVDHGPDEAGIRTEEPMVSEATGHPDLNEIADYLNSKGFQPHVVHSYSWYNPKLGALIADAQPRNFLKTETGIEPVDVLTRYVQEAPVPEEHGPGKQIVSPNVAEGTDFDYARSQIFSPDHQSARDYSARVDAATAKAYKHKPGEIHDSFGDWGDGAENSIVKNTVDTPLPAARLEVAMNVLRNAQKQGIVWHDHHAGSEVMYNLRFNKTPAETRDIMQRFGLTYKTILADGKPGEPTEALVLDTDGGAGRSVAALIHAPVHESGLQSATLRRGYGEFLGDPEGVSRDVAAANSRKIIEDQINSRVHGPGTGLDDLRNLAAEAERRYGELKRASGKVSWMPGLPQGERATRAALKSPDNEILYGTNHPELWMAYADQHPETKDWSRFEEGYLTNKRPFVSKEEAHGAVSWMPARMPTKEEAPGLFDTAAKNHGLTDRLDETGYVLPDGRKLDFSGRSNAKDLYEQMPNLHWRSTAASDIFAGRRELDHTEINSGDGTEGYEARDRFINAGAMRYEYGHGSYSGAIEVGPEPLSASQKSALVAALDNAGRLAVDVNGPHGGTVYSNDYDASETSPNRILGDIKRAQDMYRDQSDAAISKRLGYSYMPSKAEQKVFDSAINNHGTTDNIKDAGYILPDGRMLDFRRTARYPEHVLHRDIQYAGAPTEEEDPTGFGAMNKFIQSGAIRSDVKHGELEFGERLPTDAQMKRIIQAFDTSKGLVISVLDHNQNRLLDKMYDPDARPLKIISDIARAQREKVPLGAGAAAQFMPMAGPRATDFAQAEREGRTFLSPYDRAPRFEISDHDLQWKNPGGQYGNYNDVTPNQKYKLGDVIDHPDLFRNYPGLADVDYINNTKMKHGQGMYIRDDDSPLGRIEVGNPDRKDVLVHEIQHAIQEEEPRFLGKGTSPVGASARFADDMQTVAEQAQREFDAAHPELDYDELYNRLHAQFPNATRPGIDARITQSRIRHAEQRQNFVAQAVDDFAHDKYLANAGEIEAREAADRWPYTPEERAERPPYNPERSGYIPPQKSWFMPGETETNNIGATVRNADEKTEPNPGEWLRYGPKAAGPILAGERADRMKDLEYATRGQFLPALKAPPDVRAEYADTPERNAFVADIQRKARKALGEPHPLSAAAQKLPDRKNMKIEELAEFFDKQKEPMNLQDPGNQKQLSDAATHDVLARLAENGEGVFWYDVIPDGALRYMNDHIDHTILSSPENTFHYKVAQAISSQDQDVFNNTQTGYEAYKYWKEHGVFPTTKADIVGGGTKIGAILHNFKLVNDLSEQMGGWKELADLFDEKMSVKKMREEYHLNLGSGESPTYETQASLALGPKIGAFYASLNKHFENLVMDKWFTRTMGRMAGGMLDFKESAFRKQAAAILDHIQNNRIDIPKERSDAITSEINNLLSRNHITRSEVLEDAPELVNWAHERHNYYMHTDASATGGTKTYGEKTRVNMDAKNLDMGLHGLKDAPSGPAERTAYRDIINQVQQNLHKAGIDMTVADIQGTLWYLEQSLFNKVGAANIKSLNNDYLDAAYALDKFYKGENNPVVKTPKAPKKVPAAAFMPAAQNLPAGGEAPTFEAKPRHFEHAPPIPEEEMEELVHHAHHALHHHGIHEAHGAPAPEEEEKKRKTLTTSTL